MNRFTNPVIEGFSPDPSVCRVDDDYYLITSTFGYFPGVPIYHSKDLVNWQQIGNVLDRKEQINLSNTNRSQGIFAPTIRYHDGIFYVITTNVTNGGNFYVTSTDPAGPWSKPHFIDNAPGIDPSFFFDDNGKCYYVGTRPNAKGVKYDGDWEVWLQEFDLKTNQLVGLNTKIWKGALRDAVWPEAPHIYKKGGYYYLMIAEGGTSYNHAITIARSKNINGPYIGNKNNPILTHRHLGKDFPVQNVGHGDLIEIVDGQWFIVCLASRMYDGYDDLGRETFLAKVEWEDGWPVINPGRGRLLEEQEHTLPLVPVPKKDYFKLSESHHEYLYLNNPKEKNYDRKSRTGWLRLHPSKHTLSDTESPSYLGVRQKSIDFRLSTHLEEHLKNDEEAGLAIIQSEKYFIRLAILKKDNKREVQMITTIDGEETIVGRHSLTSQKIVLSIEGSGHQIDAILEENGKKIKIAEGIDIRYFSTVVAGGFVGCTMGVYAITTSEQPGFVDFEWLSLIDKQ